ncbi:MAG TPA: Flp pilus assembly protein CpaB [Mycobacteriales bacterium]|nr:Flp pilus assembly protein CpaB [Mycobacteriales bacterium]
MAGSDLARLARRVRDTIDWHRRAVAAVLVGVGVLAGLSALRPHAPATISVWTAARDLSGGSPLQPDDVVMRRLAVADVPSHALTARTHVVGRLLAAPMRKGEPFTDVRLLEPSLLAAMDRRGLVAVPVRVADGAAAAALARSGDVVDVLGASVAADGSDSGATVVAAGVTVLAVPQRDSGTSEDAGLVVVAVSPVQATVLAAAADERLSIVLRH